MKLGAILSQPKQNGRTHCVSQGEEKHCQVTWTLPDRAHEELEVAAAFDLSRGCLKAQLLRSQVLSRETVDGQNPAVP